MDIHPDKGTNRALIMPRLSDIVQSSAIIIIPFHNLIYLGLISTYPWLVSETSDFNVHSYPFQ